jgi:gamma-glutamylcyclotransferase (GGCT)/AIG2-like uncharacterized protein YtfP
LGDISVSHSLFVLGSFATGNIHHGKIAPYAKECVPATAVGSIYKLEVGYPVFCIDGADQISGQLVQLIDSSVVLPILDQFHGYNLQRPDKSPFHRVTLQVTVDGIQTQAETYSLNSKLLPKAAKILPNGDWQKLLQTEEPLTKSLTDSQKSYIKKLGFDIEIPAQIKSGEEVKEITLPSIEKEIDFIADFLTKEKDGAIGVLARSKEYLKKFKIYFQNNSRVHVLSFYEAQGVEFDTVFVVGAGERLKSGLEKLPNELLVEIKKIENDLLYVGLTRAMSRLWVFGKNNLQNIF